MDYLIEAEFCDSWFVSAKEIKNIKWTSEDGELVSYLKLDDGSEIVLTMDKTKVLMVEGEKVVSIKEVSETPVRKPQWKQLLKVPTKKEPKTKKTTKKNK